MPLTRQGTRALGPDSEIKVKAQFSKRHLSILLYTEGDRQEKAIAANATCYRDPSRDPQIPASLGGSAHLHLLVQASSLLHSFSSDFPNSVRRADVVTSLPQLLCIAGRGSGRGAGSQNGVAICLLA